MNDTPTTEEPTAPVTPPAVPPPSAARWAPPRPSVATTLIAIALIVIAVTLILYAWRLTPFNSALQDTDNAYVRGQTTVISPQVSGYVAEVLVQDFQDVKAGQVLVRIDRRIYQQRVEQARAALAAQEASLSNSVQSARSKSAAMAAQEVAIVNARAQLARAQADMRRAGALVADGSVSQREYDQTRAALSQAQGAVDQARATHEIARQDVRSVQVGRGGLEAAVEGARAALHLAEIDLDNTEIRAPADGHLSEIGVRAGQYVTAGTQLLFLVPPKLWVIANYKEAQTSHIQPGQPARLRVDALGDATLLGHVESLAPAAGSEFAVLKADNATGNFVKVAQRIAVRIAIDPDQPLASRLRPGMSVESRIDTRGGT